MFNLRTYRPLLSSSIISRIAVLLVFLILFAAAICIVYTHHINKSLLETQDVGRSMMLEDRRNTLIAAVQSMCGALGEVLAARAPDEDPRELLRRILDRARYENSGYFFAYDTRGVNIAHPYFHEFQGQMRLDIEDDAGRKYIRELTDKAVAGGGFVEYNFYKPGERERRTKLVYAHLIPDTDIWLASGLYIDDIEREQQRFAGIFAKIHSQAILSVGSGVLVVLMFVVLPVSLFMARSILKPWRQLERELMQAQKMEAIGIFAGGIAHDFSNVLGAISSCAELAMLDLPASQPLHEDLRQIARAAQRGKNLVRRIKRFSSTADAPRRTVNLARIAEECMDFVQTIIPANIEIRRRIRTGNIWVTADPDQLLQVIMNLCTNAEQAMRGHKGVLTVRLDVIDLDAIEAQTMGLRAGLHARLSVQDNGAGMSPAVQKRIFEPFFTSRKRSGGTGLGLSMTQSIVTMHGGAISVASRPGQGSTFHVLLPCARRTEEELTEDRHQDLPGGSETLLLVDDDDDLRASLGKLFTRLGYTVSARADGAEALNLFLNDPDRFDLIFTDQLMPRMTGTELIAEIRKLRPRLPIILCSGFEEEGFAHHVPQDLEEAGVAAFFRKPFDSAEICHGVRGLLDAKRRLEPREPGVPCPRS